jgi:hypothetical protein
LNFVENLAGLAADRVVALYRRFDRIEETPDDGSGGRQDAAWQAGRSDGAVAHIAARLCDD